MFVPSNQQETIKALLAKCKRLEKEIDRLEDNIAYLKTQVESADFKQKPQPPRYVVTPKVCGTYTTRSS